MSIPISLLDKVSVICIPPIVARQRFGKHVPLQQIHTTTEELLEVSFSMWSLSYRRRICGVFCVSPRRC
jgi:hypothetical protein